MAGYSNLVTSENKTLPVYRGTENAILNVSQNGITNVNYSAAAQVAANTTISSSVPAGILAGMVVKVDTTGNLDIQKVATGVALGVALNDAAGYPYESTNATASGKVTYVHGTQAVLKVTRYETADTAGAAISYAPGDLLYASANGFLTNVAGLAAAPAAGTQAVAVVLVKPTALDLSMLIQLRI